jgi:tRNA modification GTPase
MMNNRSTIAAIATAHGQGAIALIRVSGENAISVSEKIFHPSEKGLRISEQPGNTIHFGKILDNYEVIDEVLLSIFKSPRSYTGDNTVEISCHGSVYIQQKILQLLIRSGAVLARPGEFTQRAFLNGKMDLSQAEAVADLIASESSAFHKVAMQQMRGGSLPKIKTLRSRLLDFISLVELELDFSEEDVEFANRDDLKSLLFSISKMLETLTGSFAFGNALKNGIPVVIAGKPNVGKSTLLNILLKEEKALVSEIPGTTRDSIEDVIHLEGIGFRFIDTAGIRETTDTVEIMGIRRTMEKIKMASIILLMAEATDSTCQINHLLDGLRNKPEFDNKKIFLLLNKSDLTETGTGNIPAIKELYPSLRKNDQILKISAKTLSGIEELKKLLVSVIREGKPGDNDIVVTSLRHYQALKNALDAVTRASSGLENQLPGDLLAMDIREVLYYLGEITGEITTDEILGNIFKNFCIGK